MPTPRPSVHDLQVMSLTSYRAAPPRGNWLDVVGLRDQSTTLRLFANAYFDAFDTVATMPAAAKLAAAPTRIGTM
jgi:hypothetical protein